MKVNTTWVAMLAISLFAVGCGGNSSTADHSPSIRAMDAMYAPDTVTVQFGEPGAVDETLHFGEVSPYHTVTSIEQKINFVDAATGKVLARADQSFLRSGHSYTVFASQVGDNSYSAYAVEDQTTAPTDGTCQYRFVNTLPDPDRIDIYLLTPDQSIDGATPIVSDSPETDVSKTFTATAGSYHLVVKDASSGQVFVDQTLTLPANQAINVLILPLSSDVQQVAATVKILPQNNLG